MGKLITFISILIFIDILFLITGQLDISSPLSVVTGAILDPSAIRTSVFFLLFLGVGGIAALVSTSSVSSGILTRISDILIFTVMAVAMTGLLGDFLIIFLYLKDQNLILATVLFVPILLIFVMTIAEWLRGKD